jgi:hypothetical protein
MVDAICKFRFPPRLSLNPPPVSNLPTNHIVTRSSRCEVTDNTLAELHHISRSRHGSLHLNPRHLLHAQSHKADTA